MCVYCGVYSSINGLITKLCSQSICCCVRMDILQREVPRNSILLPFSQFPNGSPSKLSLFLSSPFLISHFKCPTPLSSSPPLFIGLLSGLVMIALNGFSCKCGPYGIILDKRESHFGNGCLSFGTRDWRWTLFSRRPPPRQPRYIGNRLRTMLDPEVVIVHGLPRVE